MNEDRTGGGLIDVSDLDLEELLLNRDPALPTALDRIIGSTRGYSFGSSI